ncbi:MAG: hypothetical protein FWB96_02725 [Defluviitaleaceae bacterium]|nr:hypothetical protein [Defluviitaleaceae bacterium]MCL2261783.1 hypothetical protein [Defluviitaleaceae bacterium]
MANEREMKKWQEDSLFENIFAQEMLAANKLNGYMQYLAVTNAKAMNGMTADEIDAVKKRAEETAKKYKE